MFFSSYLFILGGRFHEINDEWNADQPRNHVGDRLGKLDTRQACGGVRNEQGGDENRTRAQKRENRGNARATDALVKHIHGNGERCEQESNGCITESGNRNLMHVRAFLEKSDNRLCEDRTEDCEDRNEDTAEYRSENQSALDAGIFFCLIVKRGNRLEALTDAKSYEHDDRGESVNHAHCGDCGISVGLCEVVEESTRDRIETLADQRRESDLHNAEIILDVAADVARGDFALRHTEIQKQQDEKADRLRDSGRHSRTENAHVKDVDEEPIAEDVENSTRGKTDHRVKCLSLVAQVIVEDQRAYHKGASKQYPESVVLGVGENGIGTAERKQQGRQKDQPECHQQKP